MKKLVIIAVLAMAAMFTVSAAEEGAKTGPSVQPANQDRPAMPPRPVMGKPEMIETQVVKVYSFNDDGAKFKAYVIKYKGSEVVIIDFMGTSDKKEGDTIKVNIMRSEIPNRGKMIRFMMGEGYPGSMMKKPSSNETAPKAPVSEDDFSLKAPEAPR